MRSQRIKVITFSKLRSYMLHRQEDGYGLSIVNINVSILILHFCAVGVTYINH